MSDILLGTLGLTGTSLSISQKYRIDSKSDLQFNSRGELITVSGTDKIKQYIGKIFLTPLGASVVDPIYGSTLDSFIGSQISNETNYALIKDTMINCVSYAVTQYNDSLDETEKINSINTFSTLIDTDPLNRTKLTIQIELITEAGEVVIVESII